MATKLKLQDFFDSRRRRCTLTDWRQLKNVAGESRIKMVLSLPMLNIPPVGAHATILGAFEAMQKDSAGISRSKLEIFCEGMTIDIFATDRTPGKLIEAEGISYISAAGVMMDKFQIVGEGNGDKRTVNLEFVAYVPATDKLFDWCKIHLHEDFFLEAVYSQTEFTFSHEEEESTSDTEEEDVEAPASVLG